MREVIFCFYFIDMAVKRGNKAPSLRRDEGGPEIQVFNFMCP